MNSKFDLNISNYKKEELEDMFELSPNRIQYLKINISISSHIGMYENTYH